MQGKGKNSRHLKKRRHAVKYAQDMYYRDAYDKIVPFLTDSSLQSPHTVVELCAGEFKRYKDNIIILSGITIEIEEKKNMGLMSSIHVSKTYPAVAIFKCTHIPINT